MDDFFKEKVFIILLGIRNIYNISLSTIVIFHLNHYLSFFLIGLIAVQGKEKENGE
jgi:hypothetical protein